MSDDPKRDAMRLAADVLGLGLNVVVAAFLFGFLGRWIGGMVGARDLLTLVGGLIGAAAGFYSLYAHLVADTHTDGDRDTKSE